MTSTKSCQKARCDDQAERPFPLGWALILVYGLGLLTLALLIVLLVLLLQ
jgi:hypothetical protein